MGGSSLARTRLDRQRENGAVRPVMMKWLRMEEQVPEKMATDVRIGRLPRNPCDRAVTSCSL